MEYVVSDAPSTSFELEFAEQVETHRVETHRVETQQVATSTATSLETSGCEDSSKCVDPESGIESPIIIRNPDKKPKLDITLSELIKSSSQSKKRNAQETKSASYVKKQKVEYSETKKIRSDDDSIVRCKYGRGCLNLLEKGYCPYRHDVPDLPCHLEKKFGKCTKSKCVYKHKSTIEYTPRSTSIIEYAPRSISPVDYVQRNGPIEYVQRSYTSHSADYQPRKILTSSYAQRYIDTTSVDFAPRITRRESLHDHIKNLSESRLRDLLEIPIKVIEYGNETLFMYREKLYKSLRELTDEV